MFAPAVYKKNDDVSLASDTNAVIDDVIMNFSTLR